MTAQPLSSTIATGAASAGLVVLGIPQGMLVAAFLGALLSFYFADGITTARIPKLVFGVCALAFAAAWLGLALPRIQWTAWTAQIPPEALAGLLGMSMQAGLRLLGPSLVRKLQQKIKDAP